jgi:3-oxoacyl-[acyl-carrier protein] reductase
MTSRSLEQIRVGDEARWSHEITAEEVDAFSQLSGDVNPMHLDDVVAQKHGFRGRVVHGMLVNSFLSRVLGVELPGPGCLWLSQTTRFVQPAYIGDVITVVVRVAHKSTSLSTLVLETSVVNQRGETILTGEAKAMVLETRESLKWTDLVAVVTGGSRGVGAGIARALGERGMRVVVNYREREATAMEVIREIEASGGAAVAVRADLSSDAGAEALMDLALEAFGRVDVVVCNATPHIDAKPLLELTGEDLDRYWQAYVRSTLALVRRSAPGMKERGFGRFVNVLTSYITGTPPAEMAAYVTAKAALWGLTKAMSVELAPFGITVNAVSPSPIMTDQWAGVPESRRRALALRVPRRRLGSVDDVAAAVLYLVGESGDFVTGVNLPVTGGEVMQ